MLMPDERETHFYMSGNDHAQFDVQTDDPFWIARLDKIAMAWKANGEGRWYKIPANQVMIRAPAKPPTEAQINARKKATDSMNSRQNGVSGP